MLKGIPAVLPPELLKVMCEMGHGDRLVLADANFPAESMGKNGIVIRCDGHGIPELLEAVLSLIPLDTYVDKPVELMQVVEGDRAETPVWDIYEKIIARYDRRAGQAVEHVERYEFYRRAEECYAIIATGERALYANVIVQKGIIL